MKSFKQWIFEQQQSGLIDLHKTSPEVARMHLDKTLGDGWTDKNIPKFISNFSSLRASIDKYSLGTDRIDMPVIKHDQIEDFKTFLNVDHQSSKMPINKLKPIQMQMYLDKIINGWKKFGQPHEKSDILDSVIIVSKENYIIDGHHRWASIFMVEKNLKVSVLKIDLSIDDLLDVARNFEKQMQNDRNL